MECTKIFSQSIPQLLNAKYKVLLQTCEKILCFHKSNKSKAIIP